MDSRNFQPGSSRMHIRTFMNRWPRFSAAMTGSKDNPSDEPVRTLEDGLNRRRDNFLLLRFVAASMVIYGHGYAISGGKGFPELFTHLGWGTYSGTLAVEMFFVTSGFMIAGSYLRRSNIFDFLWARVLRIYPAYLACLVICAFVIGAIYTTLPLSQYFSDPEVTRYVTLNASLQTNMAWNLPGVFTHNPVRATINGCIWTLPAEFRMYLWVALLGILGILRFRWLFLTVFAAVFVRAFIHPDNSILLIPYHGYLKLAAMFGIGVFCYLFRRHIPVNWPCFAAITLTAYVLRSTPAYPYLFCLAVTQFVFCFAYKTPWYGFNRFGDYSYGIYLWGFPMQQIIAHHFPLLSPMENAGLAFPMALFMAVLSWNIIEKPSLKLKKLPGKFVARLGHFMNGRSGSTSIPPPVSPP